jgi:hypothetical protein
MGIRFFCPNGHKLNVKDFQAGQTGICPYCGEKMPIPLESTRPSSREQQSLQQQGEKAAVLISRPTAQRTARGGIASAGSLSVASGDPIAEAGEVVWYVHPPSGGQFGPADAHVMRNWIAEGRIGANSLVWHEGWQEWRMAGSVFSQLSPPTAPGMDFDGADFVGVPRSSAVVGRRRKWFTTMQIVLIGSLALAVIVLFFILKAVL